MLMILLRIMTFFFILTTSSYAKESGAEKAIQKKWMGWISQTLDLVSNKVGKPLVNCVNNPANIADFPLIGESQNKIKQIEDFLENKSFEKEFRSMAASLHFRHLDDLKSANFKKMSIVQIEELNNEDLLKFNVKNFNNNNIKKVHIRVWNTEASKIAGKWLPMTDSDEIRDITLYIGKNHLNVSSGIWAVKSQYKAWDRDSRGGNPATRNTFSIHPAFFRKQKSEQSELSP